MNGSPLLGASATRGSTSPLRPGSIPVRARRAASAKRRGSRGVTLLEILIVMLLLALIMGGVILGGGQIASVRLKHTATMIAGAVRVGFLRATATAKSQRIVFDMDEQTMWLEESDLPMLVQSKDTSPAGGAEAATALEKKALEDNDRILKGPHPPRPSFHPIKPQLGFSDGTGAKGPRSLDRGITFREIQTLHDDAPRVSGRAYLYFWSGGQTEPANIQLRTGHSIENGDTLTLVVSPLTGKVTVKNGPVAFVLPVDDRASSERDEKGAF
jgi:general secretion pathway protein H